MSAEVAMLMRRIVVGLQAYRYRYGSEVDLHEGIGQVLANLPLEREVTLPGGHRLDFLVDKRVAIEVKVKGSETDALMQVGRYCKLPEVHGAILATTRMWDPRGGVMFEKPVHVVRLRRLAF